MARRKPYSNTTENSGKAWTEKEREFIMRSNLSDKEIADKLKRTESAITNQRHLIYKQTNES